MRRASARAAASSPSRGSASVTRATARQTTSGSRTRSTTPSALARGAPEPVGTRGPAPIPNAVPAGGAGVGRRGTRRLARTRLPLPTTPPAHRTHQQVCGTDGEDARRGGNHGCPGRGEEDRTQLARRARDPGRWGWGCCNPDRSHDPAREAGDAREVHPTGGGAGRLDEQRTRALSLAVRSLSWSRPPRGAVRAGAPRRTGWRTSGWTAASTVTTGWGGVRPGTAGRR